MVDDRVVGRLAPSPNGALHLGHALSFLAAWWSARSKNGTLILRMEDVDAERAGQAHIESAISDLKWLGMDWDGAMRIQSERPAPFREAADRLLALGKAFPCVCSRRDLAQAQALEETPGAPQIGVVEGRYPGTCRNTGYQTLILAEQATQKEAGLRLRVEPGPVSIEDGVYGPMTFDVGAEVGDFLILRRNKSPAYQLAIVVDDHEDGVTEVVRGRDLLASTARQKLIAEALGLPRPRTFHVPLVCNHEGRRISKRENALGLAELRAQGVRPEQVVAWAKRSLGFLGGDQGLAGAMLSGFQIERLSQEDILLPEDPADLFR